MIYLNKDIHYVWLVGLLLLSGTMLMADDDDEEANQGRKGTPLMPVTNPIYAKECGSCHFAYQPGLLPARSWEQVMTTLNDHFGDNAELAEEEQTVITEYLTKNAADFSGSKLSWKILRSVPKKVVLRRITEFPYIVREHREDLNEKMVKGNPQVKSLSYCDKCHTRAAKGSYAEGEINVPGYGRVED